MNCRIARNPIGLLALTFAFAFECVWGATEPPQLPRLNWQERSDWVNVKTDLQPGAIGDGHADDTAAVQAALAAVKNGTTIYFPAGMYRITGTLKLTGPLVGVLIIGHGRDTRLVWDGPEDADFLRVDGVAYSRYVGLDFDGKGRAGIGKHHRSMNRFETEVDHRHLAFRNFRQAGIATAQDDKQALAETLFENCLFENCGVGVRFLSFNDYDFTFDGCEFRDCGIGIRTRHGNFYLRNSHFERSREADVVAGHEHGSSIRRCTSSGSRMFVRFEYPPVSPLTIQDCAVADWTGNDGAILLGGGPVILFDCRFVSPDRKAPVRIARNGQRLILSNNVVEGADRVTDSAGHKVVILELPGGRRTGEVTSSRRSFLKQDVTAPTKVFDAIRDFGARADGKTDDTAALQQTIDAARNAGNNALAYFPAGVYVITGTLQVRGSRYAVGGSGFRSQLLWKGSTDGIMMNVTEPDDVTIENLSVGQHDIGPMNNRIDIRQAGSNNPTRVTYDNVFVFGMYQSDAFRKGMVFENLGHNETVVLNHVTGNLRFSDCADATILANVTYEGSVVVAGKSPERGGLLGFMSRLSTIAKYALYVRDNHSIVMSDFYMEQGENGYLLEGNSGDAPGRIIIQAPKTDLGKNGDRRTFDIRGYEGEVFLLGSQMYAGTPLVIKTRGDLRSPELYVAGSSFYNVGLNTMVSGEQDADKRTLDPVLLANESAGSTVSDDTATAEALRALSLALDDLRRLGAADLRLNH